MNGTETTGHPGGHRARKGTVLHGRAFLLFGVLSFTLKKKLQSGVGIGRTLDQEESLRGGVSLLALQSETSCSELVVRKEEVAVGPWMGRGKREGWRGEVSDSRSWRSGEEERSFSSCGKV